MFVLHECSESGNGNGGDNDEDVKNIFLQNFWKNYELTTVSFQDSFDKGFPSLLAYRKLLLVTDM